MAVRFVVLFLKRPLVQLLQAERADEVFRMELPEHRRYTAACNRFMATRAQRSPLRVIMRLAVRQSFVVEERAALKLLSAVPAHETVRMPLTVKCRYVILHDSAVTPAALRSEHIEIILPAVRLAVPLVEALLAELFAALSAEEVLGVPGFLQGGHAFVEDGTVAVGASGGEEIMVIRLAVGMSFPLEEVPGAQLLITMSAGEMLRVPCLPQGGDHLSDDRLLAGAAASLLSSVHPLTAHVCLKVS